ncbi:MAG: DegT/DnrJ/EryC1/StrS family aminotransferase [Acidobacteriia bacterium]|nr:DegT/DnrJ/EryC1/StrS family aminotransferase [Terriglobia bacterium]
MILLNDFQRQWEHTSARILSAVAAVGESGWYVLGENVAAFEQSLAGLWQRRYAAGVASGLDALEISLRVLGCRPGDPVLTTPFSAFATTLAILKIGAVPVFVDTDRSGHIDLALCREVLRRRQDIRFLVPVHLYGNALDLAALKELRAEFDLQVVEDCAQAILASSAGMPAGSAGQLAATSFYPTKNLGALGDGGAILTDDEQFDGLVRVLRDYGQSGKYRHDEIGYNSRLDELHAAVLNRVHLPELQGWTGRRRAIAARYRAELRNARCECLPMPPGSESVDHLFPVLVREGGKQEFLSYMRSREILCGEHYPIPIPDQRAMAHAKWETATPLENARRIAGSEVSLPIHPYLTDEEVGRVIGAVNEWGASLAGLD